MKFEGEYVLNVNNLFNTFGPTESEEGSIFEGQEKGVSSGTACREPGLNGTAKRVSQ